MDKYDEITETVLRYHNVSNPFLRNHIAQTLRQGIEEQKRRAEHYQIQLARLEQQKNREIEALRAKLIQLAGKSWTSTEP